MIATIVIKDQVNVKITGLDPELRRKIVASSKYMVPHAFHTDKYKMGRWDGKVAFATIGGGTFINMLDKILPMIIGAGYDIEIDDKRPAYNFYFPEISEEIFSDTLWPEGHDRAGEPIILRDYQVKAITSYLRYNQSIIPIATGAGKTIICAGLSKLTEPYGRSLCIVPSKDLVIQTEEDYKNLRLDTGVWFGDRKEDGHTHTIATWQSLGVFDKNSKKYDAGSNFSLFLKDVVCVISDEAHGASATILQNLLTGPMANIPIRIGMTGTIPKEEYLQVSLECAIGKIQTENQVITKDLQERKVLSDCEVKIVQLQDEEFDFATYDAEHDFLISDEDRLNWIAAYCKKIVAESGNTLVIVDRIKTGNYLVNAIGDDAVFINSTVKTKDRKREYKEFGDVNGKILIGTPGCIATGVNIVRIYNLVIIELGTSFTRTIQSAGRVLRRGKDKNYAIIHDIYSNLKYSKKHLAKRKGFYIEAGFPVESIKIKYL